MHQKISLPLLFLLGISISSCSIFRNNGGRATTKTPTEAGLNMPLRKQVTSLAQEFVGAKYLYAGTNPQTGFDCSGFTSYVFNKCNKQIPRTSNEQSTIGVKIQTAKVRKGDLLFFGSKGKISHVSLVVDNTASGIECIHSTTSRGVVRENVSKSTYWMDRLLFARDVISRY